MTYNELLRSKPLFVKEFQNNYYFRLKPKSDFDEVVWKVDKKTYRCSPMHIIDYFDIDDKAKDVTKEFSKGRR